MSNSKLWNAACTFWLGIFKYMFGVVGWMDCVVEGEKTE